MPLLPQLLETLPDGKVVQVRIGLHWTAVVIDVAGEQRCGLCSTLFSGHHHGRQPPAVADAGALTRFSGRELASLALDATPTMTSVAVAALNALIPQRAEQWVDSNAEDIIAQRGRGRRVVIVGHFPFVDRLRPQVGELIVLEQDPSPGDLPAEAAPQVIPQAEVVAITGMTLTNHTLEGLLALCRPQATVLLLGPSTPLDPVLFEYGVDVLSGAVVMNIPAVLEVVSQGGNFRQVHRAGVRLVNLIKPDVP